MKRSLCSAYQEILAWNYELPLVLRGCLQEEVLCEDLTLAPISILNEVAEKGGMKMADLRFLQRWKKVRPGVSFNSLRGGDWFNGNNPGMIPEPGYLADPSGGNRSPEDPQVPGRVYGEDPNSHS